MSDSKPILPGFVLSLSSLAVLCFGLWLAFPSFQVISKIQASRAWPHVEGKVISTGIVYRFPEEGDVRKQGYRPNIWFGYHVGGQDYVSNDFQFVYEFSPDKNVVLELLKKHPVGGPVTVHYRASAPDMAVVDSDRVPVATCVSLGVGLFAAMVGFFGVWGAFSYGRENDPD